MPGTWQKLDTCLEKEDKKGGVQRDRKLVREAMNWESGDLNVKSGSI